MPGITKPISLPGRAGSCVCQNIAGWFVWQDEASRLKDKIKLESGNNKAGVRELQHIHKLFCRLGNGDVFIIGDHNLPGGKAFLKL